MSDDYKPWDASEAMYDSVDDIIACFVLLMIPQKHSNPEEFSFR